MAGTIGNQNGVKLKDPDIRQMAYKDYCKHIATGNSKDSWYFEHEQLTCTAQTFDKYLKDELEFNPIHKQIANAKGYQHWERIVHGSADGSNKEANTASLQMVMRNKFSWDKKDNDAQESSKEILEASDNLKALARTISEMKK